ncbi:MAG: phosphatase PAP2 family protein [Bacteroidota bacterium]
MDLQDLTWAMIKRPYGAQDLDFALALGFALGFAHAIERGNPQGALDRAAPVGVGCFYHGVVRASGRRRIVAYDLRRGRTRHRFHHFHSICVFWDMTPPRPYSTWRYLLLMAACYAVWVPLYFLTGWIGELRGAAFDPALAVDGVWPFIPEAVMVYLFAYVVVLALFVIRRNAEFLNYAYLNFIVMNLIAFALFALIPTMGPPRTALPADTSPILSFMFDLDVRWNAFPSLHVANPTLIMLLSFRERGVAPMSIALLVVAISIAVSTLLVRQHYVLDVIGGVTLAGMVFAGLWGKRRMSL